MSADGTTPQVLLEVKAMYSFDLAWEPNASRYPQLMAHDLAGPSPANRHDSPLLAPTLDKLGEIGRCPMTSPSTWTPDTTRRKPVTNSASVT